MDHLSRRIGAGIDLPHVDTSLRVAAEVPDAVSPTRQLPQRVVAVHAARAEATSAAVRADSGGERTVAVLAESRAAPAVVLVGDRCCALLGGVGLAHVPPDGDEPGLALELAPSSPRTTAVVDSSRKSAARIAAVLGD